MKHLVIFVMAFGLSIHCFAQDSKKEQKDSEPLYSAKNFGETRQAKEVERQMRTRDYSSFNQKIEKAVKDAVQNGSSNKSSSGSSSSSSSKNSSDPKDSSTSKNSESKKNSNSDNNSSKCTSCTKQADALKNSRKQ